MSIRNTNSSGRSFDEATVQAVWNKGQPVAGYDQNSHRKDSCGWWMQRDHYGDTAAEYGWEVDHIVPVSNDGSDNLSNLQPLHWKNNRSKGDNYPDWQCAV